MSDEIKAMGEIQTAIEDLDDDETARVVSWVVAKFGGVSVSHPRFEDPESPDLAGGGDPETADAPAFEDFAEMFFAANPTGRGEQALVAAYWLQKVEDMADLTGYEVNKLLKELGYPVSNITDAFDQLMSQKPKLAMQTKKTGTSRQARKRYRLTREGERRVESMTTGAQIE